MPLGAVGLRGECLEERLNAIIQITVDGEEEEDGHFSLHSIVRTIE